MAAGATMVLRAPLGAARRQLTVEQIAAWDAQLRERCRRSQLSTSLEVELATGEWWRAEGTSAVLAFHGTPLRDFRVSRRSTKVGRIGVLFGRDGCSDSYAFRLTGDPTDTWHLVCGGTGKWSEVNDDSLTEILALETVR